MKDLELVDYHHVHRTGIQRSMIAPDRTRNKAPFSILSFSIPIHHPPKSSLHTHLSPDTLTYPIVKSLVVLSALQRWRPDDVVLGVRIHYAVDAEIHHPILDLFTTLALR